MFYSNLNILDTYRLKIDTWDAGWYQIRRCLTENQTAANLIDDLRDQNNILASKINSEIEFYGFLDKDEIYEDSTI